eukprot:Colp12_sorted_trinity150504_noHs@10459
MTNAPTRICTTILCHATHTATELIEPTHPVTLGEKMEMQTRILSKLGECAALALCGESELRIIGSKIESRQNMCITTVHTHTHTHTPTHTHTHTHMHHT